MDAQFLASLNLEDVDHEDHNTEDEEEVAQRERELHGLLSSAFDDLSSISDASENQEDIEQGRDASVSDLYDSPGNLVATQVNHWQHLNTDISTPDNNYDTASRNLGIRGKLTDLSPIYEDTEHESFSPVKLHRTGQPPVRPQYNHTEQDSDSNSRHQEHERDDIESPFSRDDSEPGNAPSPIDEGSTIDHRGGDQHPSLHSLLEDNRCLANEVNLLKNRLTTAEGDVDGALYKLRQSNEQVSKLRKEKDQLLGTISALEIEVSSERDAMNEFMRKLSVAEATIDTLQHQMKEFGRDDCVQRAMANHDAIVTDLKKRHEERIKSLQEEITKLKEGHESDSHEVSSLRSELETKTKEAEFFRSERDVLCYQLSKSREDVTRLMAQQEVSRTIPAHRETDLNKDEQIQRMIQTAKESFQRETEERFSKLLEEKLLQQRNCLDKKMAEKFDRAKLRWKSELSIRVQKLIVRMKDYMDGKQPEQDPSLHSFDNPSTIDRDLLAPDNNSLLSPLEDFWKYFVSICNEKHAEVQQQLQSIERRTEEMNEARDRLHGILQESQLNKSQDESNDRFVLEEMKAELDQVNEAAKQMKYKLTKYKMHYKKLEQDYASQLAKKELEFKRNTETLLSELDSLRRSTAGSQTYPAAPDVPNLAILQHLNEGYIESLKQLKDHVDIFMRESNRKSLQKIASTLISYHELVSRKIVERERKQRSSKMRTDEAMSSPLPRLDRSMDSDGAGNSGHSSIASDLIASFADFPHNPPFSEATFMDIVGQRFDLPDRH